ncbi:putative ribonuclease H-like domain-containing protein [Tanacetum coccineum]
MKKMYCLVVTDDFNRFTWVFFLATEDEISDILKSFITGIENLVDYKVKVIRCDNGTEFKNKEMNLFCEMKVWNGIGVNAGNLKLLLLGITYYCWLHNLLLLVKVNAARHKLTTAAETKTVNGEVQLQALVDGKKIIITESTVRRDLQLEDVEGVDCLPNATIFEQLALMGYEQQLEGMSNHNRIYVTPSHTKKIFGNMRRVGKGFSGRETPLFQTMVVQEQAKMGEGSANPTDPHHTPTIIQPSPQPQKKQKPRKPKRKDTQIPQSSGPTEHVADEAVYKELDDSLVRAATTASSLEAEQDSGNIDKTQSKATPNEAGSQGTTSGGGPRRQETMRDTTARTRFESVSKLSNDPLLARGNTLRSGEDSLKLNELMELCTNLQTRVLDLETTKTTQANEIASLNGQEA